MDLPLKYVLLSSIILTVSSEDREAMVFAWGASECAVFDGVEFCNTTGVETWVIHQYGCLNHDDEWVDNCNENDLTNVTSIDEDTRSNLMTAWPIFPDEDGWVAQYKKFGCCNKIKGGTPVEYFKNALDKWRQNRIFTTLKSAGILPSNSVGRTRQELMEVLKGEQIQCVQHDSKQLLKLVAICYNPGTSNVITCPKGILNHCSKSQSVFYLGAGLPPKTDSNIAPYLIGGAVGLTLGLSSYIVFFTFKFLRHGKNPYRVLTEA